MSLPRLDVTATLGEGGIYQCRGDWSGSMGRPSPDVLSDKFLEYGFESVFKQGEELDCSSTELVGFIRATRAGLKVEDAYHAIGALGGTDGGVWASECTQGQFDANLISKSIGDLVDEVVIVTKETIKAAAGAASFAAWLAEHWQAVAIVLVLVFAAVALAYLLWKRKAAAA